MVLSPKKYVLLRAKVPEMNSKSLIVDDAEEHGLWVFSDGTQGSLNRGPVVDLDKGALI